MSAVCSQRPVQAEKSVFAGQRQRGCGSLFTTLTKEFDGVGVGAVGQSGESVSAANQQREKSTLGRVELGIRVMAILLLKP